MHAFFHVCARPTEPGMPVRQERELPGRYRCDPNSPGEPGPRSAP